jgi:2-polyprenyl-3-methyl-5-hydroxy-6-metoxy-1,4-benzoquinol methylase
MASELKIDPDALAKRRELLVNYAVGATVSAMVYLGLELGLYEAFDQGPATSEELAERTGLHERWLREWLCEQTAARIVAYDAASGRFSVSPEISMLLGDPDELQSLRSNFGGLAHRFGMLDKLRECFRSGIGLAWDDRGPRAAESTERLFRNWYRKVLVPVALPMLDGVVQRLEEGGAAADIGCGTGIAMVEMARAFPRAQFHGYETSTQAIERGEEHVRAAVVTNVVFHDVSREQLPQTPTYDFITTLDCLHDMTRPHEVVAAIRAAIKPDGVWFIADIDGAGSFEDNLAAKPLAPMLYALSVMSCLSSAMSEAGGAGYGILGLPEPAMRELTTGAGFTQFRRVPLPHPMNAFYEVRT